MENRLAVKLPGLDLKNPIMNASGAVYYGLEDKGYKIENAGALVTKTVTLDERAGNPQPWIVDTPSGILNSVGLANPGIDYVTSEILPAIHQKYKDLPVLSSIAGESVDEYVELTKRLTKTGYVTAIEVNLSCPNVDRGGMAFGVEAESAAQVIQAIRDVTDLPIYAKMSPNVTDIKPIVKAVEAAGADGIVLINTVVGMSFDLDKRQPKLARGIGGMSGTAVHPIAVRFVYETAQTVNIPIIGVGGINTTDDVLELLMAGASAVQVGTGLSQNHQLMSELIDQLPTALDKYGFNRITDVTNSYNK
ncbi:dihydroorotate dehydrogenase [Leuconostoc palmae]|uniref:dihydroorotate dehydrogenase n=1 Tax=Leuconostoc palmae TaxID=501487 RepID=UPI001C7CF2A8|nr:dihydroorotate dehydrogenase [Leuconostoc palmae]